MNNYSIVNLQERPALWRQAAEWFHRKWGIPAEEYLGSMDECLAGGSAVPQWYVVLQGNEIIGGAGIIANDFHERKDLTPNLCALYVEEAFRCQGIAGRLLERACRDMKKANSITFTSSPNILHFTSVMDGNSCAWCRKKTAG